MSTWVTCSLRFTALICQRRTSRALSRSQMATKNFLCLYCSPLRNRRFFRAISSARTNCSSASSRSSQSIATSVIDARYWSTLRKHTPRVEIERRLRPHLNSLSSKPAESPPKPRRSKSCAVSSTTSRATFGAQRHTLRPRPITRVRVIFRTRSQATYTTWATHSCVWANSRARLGRCNSRSRFATTLATKDSVASIVCSLPISTVSLATSTRNAFCVRAFRTPNTMSLPGTR